MDTGLKRILNLVLRKFFDFFVDHDTLAIALTVNAVVTIFIVIWVLFVHTQ